MHTKYLIGGIAVLGMLLGGCGATTPAKSEMKMEPMVATTAPDFAATKEGASKAIAAADASRKKAGKVGGEWRDTGKMIKKAKKAAEAGDFAKAVKLAKKAWEQGQMGYDQAMSQQELRMPSYLK